MTLSRRALLLGLTISPIAAIGTVRAIASTAPEERACMITLKVDASEVDRMLSEWNARFAELRAAWPRQHLHRLDAPFCSRNTLFTPAASPP
jgi:hypothetical protein